jgi:gentisate 1,2-dioxygenase
MSFISLEQLPFVGMSYEFIGETQGAPFSAYVVRASLVRVRLCTGIPTYVEVAFIIEGCAAITLGEEQREVNAGDIIVIPAHTPHRFINAGDTLLHQIDIHGSPRFMQTISHKFLNSYSRRFV